MRLSENARAACLSAKQSENLVQKSSALQTQLSPFVNGRSDPIAHARIHAIRVCQSAFACLRAQRELRTLFSTLMEEGHSLIGADYCSLQLVDSDGKHVFSMGMRGKPPSQAHAQSRTIRGGAPRAAPGGAHHEHRIRASARVRSHARAHAHARTHIAARLCPRASRNTFVIRTCVIALRA
eukprot:6197273-Pleurochrysis_carterae.AAC.1